MIAKIKRVWMLIRTGRAHYLPKYMWFYFLWRSDFWSRFLLKKIFSSKPPYPPFIEIEPTTRCNLKCVICEHTYWNEKAIDMSFEQFKHIIDQFPKLKWIGVTGIGNSFLNKDFLKMLACLRDRSIPIELFDTFNAPVGKEVLEKLVDIGLDYLWISLHGASKEVYEKTCIGGDFNRVMENIKTFVELKKQKRSHWPELSFHYIVTKVNMHEMIPFLELVDSLNADVFEVLFTPLLHPFREVREIYTNIPKEIIETVSRRGKELGINVSWNPVVPKKPPISECVRWIIPFIFATGHVIPCCHSNEAAARQFQKKHSLGNIFKQDFREIWYGEKYNELRDKLRRGEVPVQCVYCEEFQIPKSYRCLPRSLKD